MSLSYQHLIADTYHAASLANAVMTSATPVLESLRQTLNATPQLQERIDIERGFAGLELLGRQIAHATDDGLKEALVKSRSGLVALLREFDRHRIRTAAVDKVWSTWLHSFGLAATNFEMRHCEALTVDIPELTQLAGAPPPEVSMLVDILPMLIRNDWATTHDAFAFFATLELSPVQRARALLSAAQVDAFFTKDFERAARQLDEAERLSNNGRVAAARGDLCSMKQDLDGAMREFERATELSPELAVGYLRIAQQLYDQENPDLDAAEQWVRKALHYVGGLEAYEALVEIAFKRKPADLKDIVSDLTKRVVLADEDRRTPLWTSCVREFAKVDDHQTALDYIEDLIKHGSQEPYESLLWRALELERLNRSPEAIETWLQALALEPQRTPAPRELELAAERLVKKTKRQDEGLQLLDRIRAVLGDAYAERHAEQRRELDETLSIVFNADGNTQSLEGQYELAIEQYEKSLALDDDTVVLKNLVGAWRDTEHVPPGEALQQAIAAVERAVARKPDEQKRREMLATLRRELVLTLRFSLPVKRTGTVPRVAFTFPSNVSALLLTSNNLPSEQTTALLASMRNAIDTAYGLAVPLVKLRYDESQTSFCYVSLNDNPVLTASIDADDLWVHASPQQLETYALDDVREVKHPRTGVTTSFVSAKQREALKANGVPFDELPVYMVTFLHGVLERNLHELVDVDEVAQRVSDAGLAEQFEQRPEALNRLTAVLRALAEERVPLRAMSVLANAFLSHADESVTTLDIVKQLRGVPEIKKVLPGNVAPVRYVLAEEIANVLRTSIHRAGAVPVLAIDPAKCQQVLTSIREALDPAAVCTLVCDGDLRPFVHKLVELEWPDLPVLASDELLTPLTDPKTIRLEDA